MLCNVQGCVVGGMSCNVQGSAGGRMLCVAQGCAGGGLFQFEKHCCISGVLVEKRTLLMCLAGVSAACFYSACSDLMRVDRVPCWTKWASACCL
jgi:hypothetical protein